MGTIKTSLTRPGRNEIRLIGEMEPKGLSANGREKKYGRENVHSMHDKSLIIM